MTVKLEPGVVLSHFRLERELGRGGMGVVFEATDLHLGRRVALKVVRPDAEGVANPADAMNELEREARLAAAVSHPNLVTVFTFERIGNDALIAMELLQGRSLADHLKTGWRASVPEAARLLTEIASGVSAAHAAGILHLDLKPGNIMILPDGRVKVLDFGIARMARHAEYAHGALRGTPAYMAPEQLRGEPVTAATDVWAIGVIGVHLVTGVRPYDGTDPGVIAQAVLRGPPSAIGHGCSAPAVFGGLTDVLRSCLQPLRSRLPDAGALLVAIRRQGVVSPTGPALGPGERSIGQARMADSISGPVSAPVAAAVPKRRLVQLGVGAACALLVVAGAAVKYRMPSSTSSRQSGGGGGNPAPLRPAPARPANPSPFADSQPPAITSPLERSPTVDSTPTSRPQGPMAVRPNVNTPSVDSLRRQRATADSAAKALDDFVTNEVDSKRFAEAAAAVAKSGVESTVRSAQLGRIRRACDDANTLRSIPKACP